MCGHAAHMTFPALHIIFDDYLYMRYSYVYVQREEEWGWYSQKYLSGCAARFSKPLLYLWPNSAIFPALFMT